MRSIINTPGLISTIVIFALVPIAWLGLSFALWGTAVSIGSEPEFASYFGLFAPIIVLGAIEAELLGMTTMVFAVPYGLYKLARLLSRRWPIKQARRAIPGEFD